MTPPVLLVEDWHPAGEDHWQRRWMPRVPGALRLARPDALPPKRAEWCGRIAEAILEQSAPVVLVAHGLACIAVAHLPAAAAERVAGAMLVAPTDPERRALLADFAPVPHAALPYRSIVVASSNDPFCPVRLAGAYARAWGSEFVRMQNAGHLDSDSGHGEWPLGFALLQSLTLTEPLTIP
ncbi:MAG: serine hydrolase family protein [Comamonadaceae bacterium]|nr:MAG: serine hydrolase family protein [Comamonadaceae bacterium]